MYKVGFSKDIHRLVYGRKFLLAGVDIPFYMGELAHSDGDVVYHAIAESLLGSLALGDLGKHFPDNDPKYLNYDSSNIVKYAVNKIKEAHYEVVNIDVFISLEIPKLKTYIEDMRNNIAKLLEIDIKNVSVKAGTNEHIGPIGRVEAVEAYSYVLIKEKEK